MNLMFLPWALLELSRVQMFEAVHHLSCLILEKMSLSNNLQNIIGRKFLMFSCVDILRYNRRDKDVYNHSLTKWVLTLCESPSKQYREFHLPTALIRFYAVIHGVEDEESVEEVTKK